MSCEWFEERLQDILDQRQDPAADPRLRKHVRSCLGCRSLLAAQRRLFFVFPRGARREEEDLELTASADDGRLAELPGKGGATWRKWTAVTSSGAVVAALVVILAVGPMANRRNELKPTSDAMSLAEFAILAADGPSGVREPERLATIELAADEPQPMGEPPLVLLVARLSESIATLPASRLDGVHELAEGIRPLADSVGSMVEALRQRWQGSRVERIPTAPDTSWVVGWDWVV